MSNLGSQAIHSGCLTGIAGLFCKETQEIAYDHAQVTQW